MAVDRQPRRYDQRELGLIEGLAREAAYALHAQMLGEERARAEAARVEQQEQVRVLMDATEEGIYGVDRDGCCTFINRAALRMLGYARPDDLIGRNLHDLIHHTYPDGSPYQKEQCRVRLATQAGRSAHADNEVHWRADGSSFPVEYWSRPIVRDGNVVGTVVSFVDVTERKRAEAELAQHRERLEELVSERTAQLEAANKELDAFSYSVSHDLRAPLRAIDGFSQALLEDHGRDLSAEARGYLDRVRAAVQRMSVLIDDLLELSRVSRAAMRVADVDLSHMAQEIVAHHRVAEPQRRVEVVIAPAIVVAGDARLLQVALTNLLDNAWKYTSTTRDAHIEVGGSVVNGEQVLFVRDNGVGFDMQYANKLFGAFQRLHSARDFPGTGVGLATVARIIRRHGGRVWAQARPGEGATFYFTLPRGQVEPVSAARGQERRA
jgi:PAS domain S-box-containing protein